MNDTTPSPIKENVLLTPEALWKRISVEIRKSDDWEKQNSAIESIKELSISNP